MKDKKLIKLPLLGLMIIAIIVVVYLVISPVKIRLGIRAGRTEEALLFFMPAEVRLSPNETVELSLKIDTDKEAVSGVEISVNFDPTYLSLNIPVSSGTAFTSLLSQQPSRGKIILRGQGQVLGQGTVANLNFTALRLGKTKVEISQASIVWDESGQNNVFRRGVGTQLVIE